MLDNFGKQIYRMSGNIDIDFNKFMYLDTRKFWEIFKLI